MKPTNFTVHFESRMPLLHINHLNLSLIYEQALTSKRYLKNLANSQSWSRISHVVRNCTSHLVSCQNTTMSSWFGPLSNVHFRLRLLTKSIKNDNCIKFYLAKLFRFSIYNQDFFGCWFSFLSLNLHFFILSNQKLAIIWKLNYIPFTMKLSGPLNYMITGVRYDNRKRKIRKIDSSIHPNSSFLSSRVVAFTVVVSRVTRTLKRRIYRQFLFTCVIKSLLIHIWTNKEIAFPVFVKSMP